MVQMNARCSLKRPVRASPSSGIRGRMRPLARLASTCGSRGSIPHLAKDPVPVAAEIIVALQSLVTRGYNVFDPVVATVGRLASGTAGNVIPDTASMDISLRLHSPENKTKLIKDVARLVEGIASAHGMRASYHLAPDYPVTVNNDTEHRFAQDTITSLFGETAFQELLHPLT